MKNAYGGNITTVKEGTWRSRNDSKIITKCNNPNYCKPYKEKYPKAEYSSSNFLCSVGHIGPLCESCDNYGVFWGKSYQYSVSDNGCVDCSESKLTILIFFAVAIVLALLTSYTVNQ